MNLQKPEKPLSCTSETSLEKEQFVELYRYLKLTRMFDKMTVKRSAGGSPAVRTPMARMMRCFFHRYVYWNGRDIADAR